jgi:hypothetical protein
MAIELCFGFLSGSIYLGGPDDLSKKYRVANIAELRRRKNGGGPDHRPMAQRHDLPAPCTRPENRRTSCFVPLHNAVRLTTAPTKIEIRELRIRTFIITDASLHRMGLQAAFHGKPDDFRDYRNGVAL